MFRGSRLSPSAPPFRPSGAWQGSSITMPLRSGSSPSIDARERAFVPYSFCHRPGAGPSCRSGSQAGFRGKYRATRQVFLAERQTHLCLSRLERERQSNSLARKALPHRAAANQYQSTMDTLQRNSDPKVVESGQEKHRNGEELFPWCGMLSPNKCDDAIQTPATKDDQHLTRNPCRPQVH